MDLKNIHQSKTVRGILIGLTIAVVLLLVFQAGQAVGYRKARFAGNFGNNFERNFMGQRSGGMKMIFNDGTLGGHGAVGEIISINLPQLVISGPDKIEKTILVGTSTSVRRFQDDIHVGELSLGEFVVVLGNPNDVGQVEAKLIRVMPVPNEEFIRMMPR